VFYHPAVTVFTLIIGGLIMLYVERRAPRMSAQQADATVTEQRATAHQMADITWKQALAVGVAQCLAMVPGTSRSGATIIGGMIAGIQRQVATEFSFFLAMPTMLGAAVYDGYRNIDLLTHSQSMGIAVGFVGAFFSALLVVRAVLRFVSNHTYRPFAWYRIGLGLVIAAWLWL
jgi:undecaprenyl-diphosphatase